MTSLDLQSRKVWYAGAAALTLIVLLAAWFMAISPKRSEAADLRAQAADAQLRNSQLQAQNAKLSKQSEHLGEYQAKLVEALDALPAQSELSTFSQSLVGYARVTGVDLSSISVGSPTSVATDAGSAEPTTEPTDSPSVSTDGSSASAEPTATDTSSAIGAMSTTFTLQASGTTAQELAFLEAIRTGPRSALITSTQFASGENGARVTLSAQVNVFSSPVSPVQLRQLRALLEPSK